MTPLIRTRRLFLFRADFRRSAWYRDGRPPPGPPIPEELEFRWLDESDWRRDPRAVIAVPDVAGERFSGGGRCLIARDRQGDTVHEMWILPSGTWTEWIRAVVDVPDGYALFAGSWTRPDWRRRYLMGCARTLGCIEACRIGRPGLFAGIEEHEILPRAERHARNGLYAMVPDQVLVHRQVFGWSWHWREPPPPEMVSACHAAAARYPQFFGSRSIVRDRAD